MTEYWTNGVSTLYQADARRIPLPDKSVHMCVTSPPYWGLRSYDLGDTGIGLEPTLGEWVANIVEVMREVKRVLRDDGLLFLNLGDAYTGGGRRKEGDTPESVGGLSGKSKGVFGARPQPQSSHGLAPKNLIGQPWRVAFALQDDGWILRSAIVWHKPNPMPESTKDRPTSAYEMVFLLTPGQWKSRVVKFSNLECQRFHFSEYFRPDGLSMRGAARLPVDLATTIFNAAQSEHQSSLPPFYSEVWQKLSDDSDSPFVGSLPIEHRPAVWAARFLGADITAEEFLCQLESFRVTHPNGNDLLKRWAFSPASSNAPSINCDGEGTITVHYPGEICKVMLSTHKAIISRPVSGVYFYDAEAVRVPSMTGDTRRPYGSNGAWQMDGRPDSQKHGGQQRETPGLGANARNVWTIPTQGRPDAHFATFPDELPRRCILAGTSEHGVCGECGAQWGRVMERELKQRGDAPKQPSKPKGLNQNDRGSNMLADGFHNGSYYKTQTLGWQPTCACNADCPHHGTDKQSGHGRRHAGFNARWKAEHDVKETVGWAATCSCAGNVVPATILDPFVGSGTSLAVAQALGRRGVGLDLNPDYLAIAKKRIEGVPLPLLML